MRLKDADYPERVEHALFLARVRDGRQYDHILNPFSLEKNGSGEYVKLCDRRPSVRSNLCRVVVDDSVSLLFGEGRFPMVHCPDDSVRANIKQLVAESRLVEVMNAAAIKGSVGSVAIHLRVISGLVSFEVKETTFLTPYWRLDAPNVLAKVVERYKVGADDLRANGYVVDSGEYWFQREWDGDAETWYLPLAVAAARNDAIPVVDSARTVQHGLGFVPMVWINNLPGGTHADGVCTFEAAISTVMEMDYQFSQAGRGLKYASDPTLLIKEPAVGENGEFVRSASEAIVVSKDGDAKLLEISGTAAAAVVEYVRALREVAMESIHGNRTNVDKLNGAQSGRALEVMNQGLIWLADRLRITYGQYGLLELIKLVCRASAKMGLKIGDVEVSNLPEKGLSLVWPRFFPPTYDEKFQEANAFAVLVKNGLIARRTAVAKMAADNDVEDVAVELLLIEADEKAADARLAAQHAQTQAKEMVNG
jgi:hypothetical protein